MRKETFEKLTTDGLLIKIGKFRYLARYVHGEVYLRAEKGEIAHSKYDRSSRRYISGWPIFRMAVDRAHKLKEGAEKWKHLLKPKKHERFVKRSYVVIVEDRPLNIY